VKSLGYINYPKLLCYVIADFKFIHDMNAAPHDKLTNTPKSEADGTESPPSRSEVMVIVLNWLRHYWDAPHKKSKSTDWAIAALTLMIAGAAFWSAFIFNSQLRAMRKQFEATDRPWIKAEPKVESAITFHDNGDLSMSVTFILNNVGHSIATDVTVYGGALIPKPEGGEHFRQPLERQAQLCGKVQPYATTITLFPNETKEFNVGFRVSHEEIEANLVPPPPGMPDVAPAKRTNPIIFGCVDYKFSSLRQHHQTGFIYNVVGTNPKNPNVPYLIVVGETLPAANIALERWGAGGDYAY